MTLKELETQLVRLYQIQVPALRENTVKSR
jgi:hypothetical protein